jgi:2,3-dihydroxybenzoate decarboxylase
VLDHDRIYFCADYPFETMEDAADWFDATAVVSAELKQAIGRGNAIRLFGLQLDPGDD